MREKKPTNASRILKVLRDADGQWVSGLALMRPDVGGSRFSARIEELRRQDHVIEGRRSERSAVWEYRLKKDGTKETFREVVIENDVAFFRTTDAPRGFVGWKCGGCGSIKADGEIILLKETLSPEQYDFAYCLACGTKTMWHRRRAEQLA